MVVLFFIRIFVSEIRTTNKTLKPMDILNEVNEFRQMVKNNICDISIELHKSDNNGLLPKWDDGDEIVIDGSYADNYKISIILFDSCNNIFTTEHQEIKEIRVTLDSDLYFITKDCDGETHWSEVSTDELAYICHYLSITNIKKHLKKIDRYNFNPNN